MRKHIEEKYKSTVGRLAAYCPETHVQVADLAEAVLPILLERRSVPPTEASEPHIVWLSNGKKQQFAAVVSRPYESYEGWVWRTAVVFVAKEKCVLLSPQFFSVVDESESSRAEQLTALKNDFALIADACASGKLSDGDFVSWVLFSLREGSVNGFVQSLVYPKLGK